MKATLIKDEDGYSLFTREENFTNRKFIATTSGMYVDYKLSKQNCDDLFGMIDIEPFMIEDSYGRVIYNESYELGFKRAMELYQPKEIEVEIEMELHPVNHASGLELTGNEFIDFAILENYKPKLDENGCLILKKI
jgi:hypothetical protein